MASPPNDKDIIALEEILGHHFGDSDLLFRALTHPSLEAEANYQRLEFFGDRVLALVIAEALFEMYPAASEGELSQRLNVHVRKESLAEVARDLGLGAFVRMADSAEESGGRDNPSILADVMEALIAALYRDGGLAVAAKSIRTLWAERLQEMGPNKDAKTRLQEWLQGRGEDGPSYAISDRQGPDHAPSFKVRAEAGELGNAEGRGSSRQTAEFAAAEALLKKLKSEGEGG